MELTVDDISVLEPTYYLNGCEINWAIDRADLMWGLGSAVSHARLHMAGGVVLVLPVTERTTRWNSFC